jgi:hypothetical protein
MKNLYSILLFMLQFMPFTPFVFGIVVLTMQSMPATIGVRKFFSAPSIWMLEKNKFSNLGNCY